MKIIFVVVAKKDFFTEPRKRANGSKIKTVYFKFIWPSLTKKIDFAAL